MTARPCPEEDIYLVLRRTIDAPVETVYAAWTEPGTMCRWFAPGEMTVARAVAETETGGAFLVEMRGTDGSSHLTRGRYREVVPNRRLVHTWAVGRQRSRIACHRRVRAGLAALHAPDPHAFAICGRRGTGPA